MNEGMKNALIGFFILSAFAVVIFIFLFLHPSLGDKGQLIRVRFTDIDKINVGTRVTFAGKPIGEVDKIIELEDIRQGRTEYQGDVYVYELVLMVDSGLKIYNTDSISARTSGLLGEKSISIDPQPPKQGQELKIVNKEILYANQVGSVEDTFKEFKEVADKFDLALDSFTDTLHEIREKKIWDNIASTVENLTEITTKINESWPDINTAITNFSATTENFKEISEDVREGKGTMGRLISKDGMYLQATSLLSKGETVMDDINHYGILFHLDKRWQRLRARRMNLMQKLSTPQEFRNYFNDEIDQVSTSLARVSMILDKTNEFPMCPFIMDHTEFHKVFAELLRRVGTLQEALKMYNTQLMECEVKKTELVAE
jgi:phospholipid/cholesterol/gamma-HCH transport system substrate-binding protein